MHEESFEIKPISCQIRIIEPLRNYGIGSQLALACEKCCKENAIPYLGLDVNPADNAAAKRLYERLVY